MMTINAPSGLLRLLALIAAVFFAVAIPAAPTTTQEITLKPGWNAINIDVLPAVPKLDAVFANLDVDSVWAYGNDLGAPDFVQEVTEETLAKAGWFSWAPTNQPNAFQNDLFEIQVNRAYLVKLNGSADATLNLTGRPTTRSRAWLPDSWNFRGLPVDPAVPPTFLNFFKPSRAHYSTTTGLEAIYTLNASGNWQLVAPTDLVRRGAAYWIYCRGGSDYVAPFSAAPVFGDGLDFDVTADFLELNLRNFGTTTLNATISDLNAPATNPLSIAQRNAEGDLIWPALPQPMVRAVAGGATVRERIAVRRADMTSDLFETVLEITDGLGSRHMVPIVAARLIVAAPLASSGKSKTSIAQSVSAAEHAGLWVGVASVKAVSEAHSGPLQTNESQGFSIEVVIDPDSRVATTNRIPHSVSRVSPSMAPTPTGSEFNLRLLVHVDSSGRTRLLKEVIQMWKNGVTTNDADGNQTVIQGGRYVLVTDDTKVSQFTGVTSRDGTTVGRRLSSAAFDFTGNELLMNGNFAVGSAVTGLINVSPTSTLNPFKHRYHPDHQEGYRIERTIELEFSPPPANAPPGYDERVIDGIYRETIKGLHRTDINVSGNFRLTRIVDAGLLNQ